MFQKLKDSWTRWREEKKYTITIYFNSSTIDSEKAWGDALEMPISNYYRIRIHKDAPHQEAILAHEIGHCMEGILNKNWGKTSYATYRKTQKVDMDILRCEAYAWRWARKILPDLEGRIIKWLYSGYVSKFKR